MFGRFRQFQIRLAAAACLSLPVMTFGQESVPAPPPPEGDAVPEVAAEPAAAPSAAAEDGVARVPAAVCRPAGCSPSGACSTDGKCAACSTGGACRPGACATGGGCSVNGCRNGCQLDAAGNGLPCLTCPSNCLSPEVCMGRGYTIGDLKRGLHHLKWRARECCGLDGVSGGGALHSWWYNQQYRANCRRAYRNHVWNAHLHNKLNYFIPSGCCGEGCPPFGEYKRVYAADPSYFDQRDTRLYAAPATGVPTAIPLAPNVRHQYNYSWGIPSSRVTPISSLSLQRR